MFTNCGDDATFGSYVPSEQRARSSAPEQGKRHTRLWRSRVTRHSLACCLCCGDIAKSQLCHCSPWIGGVRGGALPTEDGPAWSSLIRCCQLVKPRMTAHRGTEAWAMEQTCAFEPPLFHQGTTFEPSNVFRQTWEDREGGGHQNKDRRYVTSLSVQDVITPLYLQIANSSSCHINVHNIIYSTFNYLWFTDGRTDAISLPADYKQPSDGVITTASFPGLALATFLPSSLCTQSVTEYISSTHCTAANPSNLIAMYKFLLAGQ